MAIVVESVSSGSSPITKPTGLAVGDLMVAVVGGAHAKTATTPSGWTALLSSSSAGMARGIFYKVADSSDVAASNFTFNDTTPAAMSGVIYRISGAVNYSDLSFLASSFDDNNSDSTVIGATALTTTHASALFIASIVADDSSTGSFASYSLGVSTSFTERYDGAPSYRNNLAVVDAPLSTAEALGNFSATMTGFGGSYGTVNVGCIVIYEKVDANGTTTFLQATPVIYQTVPQMIVATPTIYSVTAAVVTPTSTNTTKHAGANIVNTSKS